MLQYNTIAAAMVEVNNDQVNAGFAAAKDIIGDTDWKRGWTADRQKIARDCLRDAGAEIVEAVEGVITSVHQATTAGGKFRKVRMELSNANLVLANGKKGGDPQPVMERPLVLSLEIEGEFTQRLLSKLTGATCGSRVRIGGFASVSPDRGGKTYANHACTLKEGDTEIRSTDNHFSEASRIAQEKVTAVEKLGVKDRATISTVKAGAKADYFWDLVMVVASRFSSEGNAGKTSPAMEEPSPALETAGFDDPW